MSRTLEKTISIGNMIDLISPFFYQLGLIKANEIPIAIEVAQGDESIRVKFEVEKELEVTLIEHHGKKLQEGSQLGGQTRTGETS